MHSKVLKIGTVLLACVCLVSIIAFPVSAESSFVSVPIKVEKIWTNAVDDNTYTQYAENEIAIKIPYDSYKNDFACIYSITNPDTENFYNYKFEFSFGMINPTNLTCKVNDVYYQVTEYDSNTAYYSIQINNVKFTSQTFRVEFDFSFNTSTNGWFYIYSYKQYSDENVIIDNQNENTDKIIAAQQEATQNQTEEITDGWGGADEIDNSTANDYLRSESAALGGKTDEEIQEEIDNALDFDIGVFDSVKVGKIHSLFDNVLDALGVGWQSLFLLCLTLGLGAFLIGRRYG